MPVDILDPKIKNVQSLCICLKYQVEVIELVNNGSGLGFGIIGGQQAGVIVKTILPEGVADRDGRLKPNDFILQVSF
jgi:hypothetical protein